MTPLRYYEAPRRFTLDGFIDPVELPSAIRVVAPPNAKSSHALAGAICRDLGAVRDLYTQAHGETVMLSSAVAWSLATGITDIYIAAAEDLTRAGVYDCIHLAGRIGATLHLVFSYGQVHTHLATLNEVGFRTVDFTEIPAPLRDPSTETRRVDAAALDQGSKPVVLPDDHWMTFRAAYRSSLPDDLAEHCDNIYLDAYETARASTARSVDEIAALAGDLWQRFGIGDTERIVSSRAMQAALFRNGLLVRLDMAPFTRHVQLNYVNAMTTQDYQRMRDFVNPSRAAATVLHAHHVSTEDSLALRALDVTPHGNIPLLGIDFVPEARTFLAAQRWHQLITQDANPPLFKEKSNPFRAGIRKMVQQLDLPVIPYWRSLKDDKGRTNIGIRVEVFA